MSKVKDYAKKIQKKRDKSDWAGVQELVKEALEQPDIKLSQLAKEMNVSTSTVNAWKFQANAKRIEKEKKKKKEEEKEQPAEFKGKFKAAEVKRIGEGEAEEVAKVRINTQTTASLIEEATEEVMEKREEDVAFAMRLRREFGYLRAKIEKEDIEWEDYVVAAVDYYEKSDEVLKRLDAVEKLKKLLEKDNKSMTAQILDLKTRLHEHRELIAMSMNLASTEDEEST